MTQCIHRGEVWREVVNRLCGMRGQLEPVYRCRLHVICTHRKHRHGQTERVCLACDDYTEATSDPKDPASSGG